MIGKSVPEIAAFQWAASNDAIIESLETLSADRYAVADYRQLVASPADTLGTLCRFAGIQPQRLPGGPLPLSRTSLTAPHPDKWRKHEREIMSLLPDVEPTWRRMQAFR